MKLPIIGHCLCNTIKYEINTQPKRMGFCFCRSCQIKSGSDHIAYLAVEIDGVKISGAVKWYESVGDSGKSKQHGFCPDCGTILFGKPSLWPNIFVIYAGSIDNLAEFSPEVNLWIDEAQPWACINKELIEFDKNP